MSISLSNKSLDRFFGFMSKLDNIAKRRLIVKLEESIEPEENKKFDLHSLYGAWVDTRTSDEIIEDIKASRVEKQDEIDF